MNLEKKKTYDKIDREVLRSVLRLYGIGEKKNNRVDRELLRFVLRFYALGGR